MTNTPTPTNTATRTMIDIIFGWHDTPENAVVVLPHLDRSRPDPRLFARSADIIPAHDLDAIAAAAAEHTRHGWDSYVSVALLDGAKVAERRETTKGSRGAKADVIGLPALIVDMDVHTGVHGGTHGNPLPTPDEGMAMLLSFPLAPTLLVSTGGGYHGWWGLDELLDPDDDLLPRWKQAWLDIADRAGRHIDASVLADSARVLRLAGTANHKSDPPRPVELVVTNTAARWSHADLDDVLPIPAPQKPAIAPSFAVSQAQERGAVVRDRWNASVPSGALLAELGLTWRSGTIGHGHESWWDHPDADRNRDPGRRVQVHASDGHVTVWGDGTAKWMGMTPHHGESCFGVLAFTLCGGDFGLARRLAKAANYDPAEAVRIARLAGSHDALRTILTRPELLPHADHPLPPPATTTPTTPTTPTKEAPVNPSPIPDVDDGDMLGIDPGSDPFDDDDYGYAPPVDPDAPPATDPAAGDDTTATVVPTGVGSDLERLRAMWKGDTTGSVMPGPIDITRTPHELFVDLDPHSRNPALFLRTWKWGKDLDGEPIEVSSTTAIMPWVAWRSEVVQTVVAGVVVDTRFTVTVLADRKVWKVPNLTAEESTRASVLADRLPFAGLVVPADRNHLAYISDMLRRLCLHDMTTATRYQATGWEQIDGKWVFVAPAGSVGAEGIVEGVEVVGEAANDWRLDEPLDRIGWERCPDPDELPSIMPAITDLLGVLSGSAHPTAAVAALGVMAAPMLDLGRRPALLIPGAAGSGKSNFASLFQTAIALTPCDGATFPISIINSTVVGSTATARFLRGLTLVADDWKSKGNAGSRNSDTPNQIVEELARAAYGAGGSAKGTQTGGRAIRGAVSCGLIVTSEAEPTGSTAQRFAAAPLRPGVDIPEIITGAIGPFDHWRINHGNALHLNALFADYVRWLASERDRMGAAAFAAKWEGVRREAFARWTTARAGESVAGMETGWAAMREWAEARGVGHLLPSPEVVESALKAILASTTELHATGDAGTVLVDVVLASMAGGRAHLIGQDTDVPGGRDVRRACGWRERPVDDWVPMGDRIGHLVGKDVALYPDALMRVVAHTPGLAGLSRAELGRAVEAAGGKTKSRPMLRGKKAPRNLWSLPASLFGITPGNDPDPDPLRESCDCGKDDCVLCEPF
jgi:hypothetical protein